MATIVNARDVLLQATSPRVLTIALPSNQTVDFSQVNGTTKPSNNADVTVSAVNGGIVVTGGGITLSGGGSIKGGQTAYNSGIGFFLGYSGAAYKLSIGNSAGTHFNWDGSTLDVNVNGAARFTGAVSWWNDVTKNVGLDVQLTGANTYAVSAVGTTCGLFASGQQGVQAQGNGGWGVLATAIGSSAVGVRGETNGSSGWGIHGKNTSAGGGGGTTIGGALLAEGLSHLNGDTRVDGNLAVVGSFDLTGAMTITSGVVVAGLNADKVDGFHAGNASGNVPVSNGTVNANLNADMVDGYHASDLGRLLVGNTGTATASGGGFNVITGPGISATYKFTGSSNNLVLDTVSDRALKRDIEDEPLGRAALLKIRPVQYRMIDDPDYLQHGFIAQEMAQVVCPNGELDSLAFTGSSGYMGINYHAVTPILVNGFQEHDGEIETLKSQLAALSQRLQALGG
jgi:hypothetical protein